MIRIQTASLAYYSFASPPPAEVLHGAFTRLGGASRGAFAGLNVGHTVGDDVACVAANHAALYQALGVRAEDVVTARQVHGDRVAIVTARDGGRVLAETDALITGAPDVVLLLRFADCVPVFLYAPRQKAVGLAHAGWQGTLKEIAAQAARAVMTTYDCRSDELWAGLGPAIGPCCFEVGPEVVAQFRHKPWAGAGLISRPQSDGRAYVDLWQANAQQLQAVGVTHIEATDLCTCCRRDEFFSHRGTQGHTGRFAAVIGVRGRQSK